MRKKCTFTKVSSNIESANRATRAKLKGRKPKTAKEYNKWRAEKIKKNPLW